MEETGEVGNGDWSQKAEDRESFSRKPELLPVGHCWINCQ